MCFVKNLIVTYLVRSLVEINNPGPISQARFPQIRDNERLCVASSNKRSDRWAL